jgi:hypothetical protein
MRTSLIEMSEPAQTCRYLGDQGMAEVAPIAVIADRPALLSPIGNRRSLTLN